MSLVNDEGRTSAMIGNMKSTPTKVLIAAAVTRMIEASPKARSPRARR